MAGKSSSGETMTLSIYDIKNQFVGKRNVYMYMYIVTKIIMCLPMLGDRCLGGLITPTFPFIIG